MLCGLCVEFRKSINDFNNKDGVISALVVDKTVIVIAHRLQSICNADQIIVLEDGRVRESGNHEELIRVNGIYKKLWDEQNKAGSWQI